MKRVMHWLLGFVFIVAGLNHFRVAEFYARIMPPYLPWHLELVYVSGVIEAALGVLLLVPRVYGPGGVGTDRALDPGVSRQHPHGAASGAFSGIRPGCPVAALAAARCDNSVGVLVHAPAGVASQGRAPIR